jgi:hypothetical protein
VTNFTVYLRNKKGVWYVITSGTKQATRVVDDDGVHAMSTLLNEKIETGDVIELELEGETTTAMVLLSTGEMVILDLNDGSTPLVARVDELGDFRLFAPERLGLAA